MVIFKSDQEGELFDESLSFLHPDKKKSTPEIRIKIVAFILKFLNVVTGKTRIQK